MAKKKAKVKEKRPPGRPSTFTPEKLDIIQTLHENGYTDTQVASAVGVTKPTYMKWRKEHPEFFTSLRDWRETADKDVERSLFQRANGYWHEETKVHFDQDGNPSEHKVRKYYPPDSTAMIFWLKNRKRKEWRDRQEIEHSGSVDLASVILERRKKAKGGSDA